MPPIMGATAFVMASFLERPYIEIALAATIPSILYYFGLFAQIDAYAARRGLKGIARAELPSLSGAVKEGWLYLFVFALLIFMMVQLRQDTLAPFYATALLLVPQAAEAGTVVASSGPSASTYRVGTQIGNTQRITLRQGDSITVLDNGGTRVLRGPGTFILARQGGQTNNRAFTALTTQRSATRARTGAVRGVNGAEKTNPNLWYVDVAAEGTICVNDPDNIRLWRADTQAQSTYTIASQGAETTITFPAGEMLAAWDIYNLPEPETTYSIGTGGSAVEGARTRVDARAAGSSVDHAHRWRPRLAGSPPDAERHHRVEFRPPRRLRTIALRAAVGACRRLSRRRHSGSRGLARRRR